MTRYIDKIMTTGMSRIWGIRVHLSKVRSALMRVPGVDDAVAPSLAGVHGKKIVAAARLADISTTEKQILGMDVFTSSPSLPSGKIDKQAVISMLKERSRPSSLYRLALASFRPEDAA